MCPLALPAARRALAHLRHEVVHAVRMARDRPLHVIDARQRYGEHLRDDIDPVRGTSASTRVARESFLGE